MVKHAESLGTRTRAWRGGARRRRASRQGVLFPPALPNACRCQVARHASMTQTRRRELGHQSPVRPLIINQIEGKCFGAKASSEGTARGKRGVTTCAGAGGGTRPPSPLRVAVRLLQSTGRGARLDGVPSAVWLGRRRRNEGHRWRASPTCAWRQLVEPWRVCRCPGVVCGSKISTAAARRFVSAGRMGRAIPPSTFLFGLGV